MGHDLNLVINDKNIFHCGSEDHFDGWLVSSTSLNEAWRKIISEGTHRIEFEDYLVRLKIFFIYNKDYLFEERHSLFNSKILSINECLKFVKTLKVSDKILLELEK